MQGYDLEGGLNSLGSALSSNVVSNEVITESAFVHDDEEEKS